MLKNNIIATIKIVYIHPIGKGEIETWIETKSFKPDQPISDIFKWAGNKQGHAVNVILTEDKEC